MSTRKYSINLELWTQWTLIAWASIMSIIVLGSYAMTGESAELKYIIGLTLTTIFTTGPIFALLFTEEKFSEKDHG